MKLSDAAYAKNTCRTRECLGRVFGLHIPHRLVTGCLSAAFTGCEPDWLRVRDRTLVVWTDVLPQRNCGRFSRPSPLPLTLERTLTPPPQFRCLRLATGFTAHFLANFAHHMIRHIQSLLHSKRPPTAGSFIAVLGRFAGIVDRLDHPFLERTFPHLDPFDCIEHVSFGIEHLERGIS